MALYIHQIALVSVAHYQSISNGVAVMAPVQVGLEDAKCVFGKSEPQIA